VQLLFAFRGVPIPIICRLLIASFALFSIPAHAFVSAGDRMFPGTLILPQIAPTDETYIQGATPFSGMQVPLNTRRTDVIGFFGKTSPRISEFG